MQARQLSSVALKTWAVVLLLRTALQTASVLSEFGAGAGTGTPPAVWRIAGIWNLASLVLVIATGVGLLKYADRLTERLFGTEEISLAVDAQQLERVAFGTIGVYFIILGLKEVGAAAFEMATRPEFETAELSYLWKRQPSLIVDGSVEFLAGACLLLGRRGFAMAWSKFHGYDPPAESEAGDEPSVDSNDSE